MEVTGNIVYFNEAEAVENLAEIAEFGKDGWYQMKDEIYKY